jgi:hypothetical protein
VPHFSSEKVRHAIVGAVFFTAFFAIIWFLRFCKVSVLTGFMVIITEGHSFSIHLRMSATAASLPCFV